MASHETIAARIDARFGDELRRVPSICNELTYEVDKDRLLDVATALRDESDLGVDQLIDACGVDYLSYGEGEWKTETATESGFSRGVERKPVILDESDTFDPRPLRGRLSPDVRSGTTTGCDCAFSRASLTRRSCRLSFRFGALRTGSSVRLSICSGSCLTGIRICAGS